jgi:hypothetical protein
MPAVLPELLAMIERGQIVDPNTTLRLVRTRDLLRSRSANGSSWKFHGRG